MPIFPLIMKKTPYSFFILIALFLISCNNSSQNNDSAFRELIFQLKNPTDLDLDLQTISLDPEFILNQRPDINWTAAGFYSDGSVSFEYTGFQDGTPDEILLFLEFKAGEEKTITFKETKEKLPGISKKTQAEISIKQGGKWEENKYIGGDFVNVPSLRVPDEHTDHSEYIRYEGPGWESDKVGYRFYLDWRNAVDIFGKETPEMVLQGVGLDGFDAYHEPSDWGMDILKVGESLGIGSIGYWDGAKALRVAETDSITCDIVENGNLRSKIRTIYSGWEIAEGKTTLTSNLTINAGSRLTKHDISLSNPLDNICTGIVKHEKAKFFSKDTADESSWGYIANYGQQSLNNDNLGMAILFKKSELLEITEDEHSHVIVLNPTDKQISYYFLAAWEKEPEGIRNEEEFLGWLDEVVQNLDNPITLNSEVKQKIN